MLMLVFDQVRPLLPSQVTSLGLSAAQANWRLAVDQGLAVVPALNKCDLPQADPEAVTQQLQDVCGVHPDEQVIGCFAFDSDVSSSSASTMYENS
jgi:translation elongation factor EF-4